MFQPMTETLPIPFNILSIEVGSVAAEAAGQQSGSLNGPQPGSTLAPLLSPSPEDCWPAERLAGDRTLGVSAPLAGASLLAGSKGGTFTDRRVQL